MATIGKGVNVDVKGSKVIITLDTSQNQGPSKSGKTTVIATSGGNQSIAVNGEVMKLGVNLYK